MPAVVSHSDSDPYMAMARFETGPGGNPHWHGMSVGRRCPQFRHVKDDVGGAGDMPPETVSEDVVVCRRFWERRDSSAWPEGVEKPGVELEDLIRSALTDGLPSGAGHDLEEASDDEAAARSPRDASSDGDGSSEDAPLDLLEGRVKAVLQSLVDAGLIEVVRVSEAAASEGVSSLMYRRVPPVPKAEGVGRRWRKGEICKYG